MSRFGYDWQKRKVFSCLKMESDGEVMSGCSSLFYRLALETGNVHLPTELYKRSVLSDYSWLHTAAGRTARCIGVSRNTALAEPSVPAPKIDIFWLLKQDCFRCTSSQYAIGRFSWISCHNCSIGDIFCFVRKNVHCESKNGRNRSDYT